MKTRSKSCPFAPRELPRFNATMGRSDSQPSPKRGYVFPLTVWTWATCCPDRLAGPPRFPSDSLSACRLQTPRADSATLLFSHRTDGRFPHIVAGSPPPVCCHEAEASSLALRPAPCLDLSAFFRLAWRLGSPLLAEPGLRGEQAITTVGTLHPTGIARTSPGAQLLSTIIKKTWIAERANFRRHDEPGNGLLDTSFRRQPESSAAKWSCTV